MSIYCNHREEERSLKENKTMGDLIKTFIKLRGRNIKDIADEIGKDYKTVCGWLNRDCLTAEMLFKLSVTLDIDLNWMACALGYYGEKNKFASEEIPRMQNELRSHDYPKVEQSVLRLIKENPGSIASVRGEMLKGYDIFYLLDILLPEQQEILVQIERGTTKYLCKSLNQPLNTRISNYQGLSKLIDGKEMLDILIAGRMRKDENIIL